MKNISQEEARKHFEYLERECAKERVTQLKTPLFQPSFAERLIAILQLHTIRVEVKDGYCLVSFPPETYKTELLPRTQNEKYRILLPDGFELFETRRRQEEFSYLQIDTSRA